MTSVQGRAGRVGAAAIAALASRLTERDQLVALACYEHRALTTEQLRRLYFGSSRRACARLAQLQQLRVLDRFRPPRQPGEGSAPYHWVLDEAGAHIAAEALGVERSELRWRHQAAIGIAGYIPKSTSRRELSEVIAEVLNGSIYVPPEMRVRLAERAPETEQKQILKKLRTLTPQQLLVLEMISTGLQNKQIAYDLKLAETTVKAHGGCPSR